jgi:hypothetical protein
MPRKPLWRTSFSDLEKAIIRALGNVTYLPGSSGKRFARVMNDIMLHRPERGVTYKQRIYLQNIAYRYRKQMPEWYAELADYEDNGIRPADEPEIAE